jgi:D-alanine transaminase
MTNVMKPPSQVQRENGVACVTADDFRWAKAHIKATSLLGAVFARQISFDVDAVETVMFRDGYLSEAAACNVWIVKEGRVIGTPKDNLVLEGIRYGLIEDICIKQGIAFELRRVTRAEVMAADEVLLSSATKEVLPVTLLDGQPVGSGAPGPVYARLFAGYQEAKADALQTPA